ncbi:MAG: ADP-forming succinate--CoA ligase subunit beta [candidate division Zixibacteria bacterium]|nr:ADP-forming succinate--CoA ligase subunit beta [candidate division Zixibacteria bacterium]
MRLYEYEAKQIFSEFGIPLPQEKLVTTPEEAEGFASRLGKPVVLKVQILSGGRGKAGGIKFAETSQEAKARAIELFSTKTKGYPVNKILIGEKLNVKGEFYLGITIDRINYKIVILACAEGGMEIEEIAKTSPQKIKRIALDIDDRFYPFQAQTLAKELGFSGSNLRSIADIVLSLYALFKRYDAKLVEINPLILTSENKVIAADARMSIDDDALFRHPELEKMGMEKRHEEGEMTEREKQAKEWEIPYLDLDGDIGMFPGGAGFGIMGNDFIHHFGGKPANFMDSGGGPTPERLAKMLILLDENPKVKVIFAARFGGISRCDDFAKGVVKFLKEHGLSKPMVMRMTGNMWQEGVKIFQEAKKESPKLFEKIEIHGIETPIEEIAKRAVELTKSVK